MGMDAANATAIQEDQASLLLERHGELESCWLLALRRRHEFVEATSRGSQSIQL